MIIVLKGADFSANNIGQIDVPIEYEPETLAYKLEILPVSSGWDFQTNRAINRFVRNLKSSGLWPKITHLFLPVFGRVHGGVNLKDPAYNIGFPETNATYSENGVLFAQPFQTPNFFNLKEQHVGTYNSTAGANQADAMNSIAASQYEFLLGRNPGNSASGFRIQGGTINALVSGRRISTGPLMGSHSQSVGIIRALVDTEVVSTASSNTTQSASSRLFLGGNQSGSASGTAKSYNAIFTFGAPLTGEELSVYGALQTELMTVLL